MWTHAWLSDLIERLARIQTNSNCSHCSSVSQPFGRCNKKCDPGWVCWRNKAGLFGCKNKQFATKQFWGIKQKAHNLLVFRYLDLEKHEPLRSSLIARTSNASHIAATFLSVIRSLGIASEFFPSERTIAATTLLSNNFALKDAWAALAKLSSCYGC